MAGFGSNMLVYSGASYVVPTYMTTLEAMAFKAIHEAREAIEGLEDAISIPQSTAVPGQATGNITYPSPGNAPIWTGQFNAPIWNTPDPTLSPVGGMNIPAFNATAPAEVTPYVPVKPNISMPSELGSAPTPNNIDLPSPPSIKTINDPLAWEIALPISPSVDIVPFTGNKPSSSLNKPSIQFNWDEEDYNSSLLTKVSDRIEELATSGVGIPEQVWEAIWARDNDRENRAAEKLIAETNEEWSSRGFSLPQGVQLAQIAEARQQLQSSAVGRSRDIAIREADLQIENLRFAVQQGIALETIRGGWHQASMSRYLEAARFTVSTAIELFNADISFYNAQIQLYSAEASVYKTQIESELAKLEVFKTELEAQKLISDLNQQQIDMYLAKLQGVKLDIEVYNGLLAGAKAEIDIDMVKLESYKSDLVNYGEKLKAVSVEYDAYSTEMQGAKLEADIYDTSVKSFSALVGAHTAQIDGEAKRVNAQVDVNKYQLEEHKLKLDVFLGELNGEVEALKAKSAAFDSEVKAFDSKVKSSKTDVDAQTAALGVQLQNAKMITDVNIANAAANSANANTATGLASDAMLNAAKINSALAGSALSAFNLSAGIRDSANNNATIKAD